MNAVIQFEVAVERHEPSRAFVARCADFPGKVGIGLTEEEAVADLRKHMPFQFLQPISPPPPAVNPWEAVIGVWKDHPLLDEWRKGVEEYRASKDREEEAGR